MIDKKRRKSQAFTEVRIILLLLLYEMLIEVNKTIWDFSDVTINILLQHLLVYRLRVVKYYKHIEYDKNK